MAREPDNDELARLLAATALGDQQAFARLYRQSSGRLYAIALRMLRRADWAEEVLQESFVSIWRSAGSYQAALSAPGTWMVSIVRNRCLDWLRRPRLEEPDEDGHLTASLPSREPGPLDRLAAHREAGALRDCLARLEQNQRQALLLAYYDGLSHGELARQVGQPLGTVKSWVRRGVERLRQCLGQQQ